MDASADSAAALRELADAEREAQLRPFVERHPQLATFAASPSTALVELAVDTLYLVRRFQNVTEIHLG